MGSRQGIPAGKALVEFILSDKKLDSQLAAIGKKMRSIGTIGLAATAPIVAGFAAAARSFANAGSALFDMSQRTGVSASQLAELGYAADQTGTDIGTVEKALRAMQAKGLDPNNFSKIAAEIAGIEDPTQRAQAAMQQFGKRTGAELGPMLKELPALTKHFRDLGLAISEKDVKAADDLGDALGDTKKQFAAMAFQIGAAVAGPLTDFLKWSVPALKWVIDFIKEHKKLVTAIAGISTAVFGLSLALIGMGFAIDGVTKGLAAAKLAGGGLKVALVAISANPVILGLVAVAGAVMILTDWLNSGTTAAKAMKKALDAIRPPGKLSSGELEKQLHAAFPKHAAAGVALQANLSSAMSGARMSPVAAAAAGPGLGRSVFGSGANSNQIIDYLRKIAESNERIRFNTRDGMGMIAGPF